ncbi:IS1380 family transposase [Kineococcus sp. R86509]|uniref:IS1380 family transposase n=1 Tax=Kineococcus sp. R86509 TaxID=3093851 RepID=UPI0036D403EE
MQVSHALPTTAAASSITFDDPNLIAHAGLAPALQLAQTAGLHDLLGQHLTLAGPGSANAAAKATGLVAGMLVGADSIDDMDVLRHGANTKLFDDVRAPSTLGTFLRTFTHGHVRQLDAVAARFLTGLQTTTAAVGSPLLADADQILYVDVDDTIRQTYGYAKQGAGYGYSKVKGLNAMLVTATTPASTPVIVGTRLRKGSVASAKGAPKLLGDALATLKRTGTGTGTGTGAGAGAGAATGGGLVIVRADSAYYNHAVIAAARRGRARFSLTARSNPAVRRAIAGIADDAWTPIKYTDAVWDEDDRRWVSDAEVAETTYTAFTGRRKAEHVRARLIVRRVKRLNPAALGRGQGELFETYRYHAVFTDSPLPMLVAEKDHRAHAVIESVIAEAKDGPLAHLPSGKFQANAAWLVLAAITHNLTRAIAALAGTTHRRERAGTIRGKLISLPARVAFSARRLRLHAPSGWPWQSGLENVLAAIVEIDRHQPVVTRRI